MSAKSIGDGSGRFASAESGFRVSTATVAFPARIVDGGSSMKSKEVTVAAVWATCPHCGGDLCDDDNGSLMIVVSQHKPEDSFECIECYQFSELPARCYK